MVGLSIVDSWAVAAIVTKVAGYLAALLAIGGALFVITFPAAPVRVNRLARQIAIGAALCVLVVLALGFGIRAGRIAGMGLSGMTDPMMLGLVWDSPLGTAALFRGGGAVLILGLLLSGPLGRLLAVVGAVLVALSYAMIGTRWASRGFCWPL